eukprot:g40161.t1
MFFGNWADPFFIPFTVRTDYLEVLGIWFHVSSVLESVGLALLPQNAPSSWTVPYRLSFMEKFAKKNTFDHKSIRKWSVRGIFVILWEKDRVDPV